LPDQGEKGVHMHSGGLLWGLELGYVKEVVCVVEYVSWSTIWRMSSVEDGDSCSGYTDRARVG